MAFPAAAQRIRDVVARIAATEDAAALRREGIDVLLGRARFTGPGRSQADGRALTARRFVLATGAAPLIPTIPGFDAVPYLTNETIFDLPALPASLAVSAAGRSAANWPRRSPASAARSPSSRARTGCCPARTPTPHK